MVLGNSQPYSSYVVLWSRVDRVCLLYLNRLLSKCVVFIPLIVQKHVHYVKCVFKFIIHYYRVCVYVTGCVVANYAQS